MDAGTVAALRLRTLGRLELEGADLSRPKPLLLLAYLALEGRQSRRHLAELFFAGTAHPLQSLSVTLSRLRSVLGGGLTSDDLRVTAALRVDASDLVAALDADDLLTAERLYRGPFLEGVPLDGLGVEVEEWALATREYLADALRAARLAAAEQGAAVGRLEDAACWAEAAWQTAGASEPGPEQLTRLHDVLLLGHPVLAARAAKAADAWGIGPLPDEATVRARFQASGARPEPARDPSEFIGRARERKLLLARLMEADVRLVSLVGPGGVGKTRLALEVARELERDGAFPDGVHVVLLEDVIDPARVAPRVAHTLGIALSGPEAAETRLARSLRDRRALILLDNAEGVLAGVATLVAAAAQASGLRWLATSREVVGVSGEVAVPLDGLELPPEGETELGRLRAADAVVLFLARAQRYGSVGDDDVAHVARLCRSVGGWPLALEIAASLMRIMPVSELADELEHRLDVLDAPGAALPERQRSVLGVIESTWSRLDEADRDALALLGVFRGGFNRTAAEAVAGVGVARLARLVDRALVHRRGERRFDLHPLVARFARDRLAQRVEAPAVERRHAAHYLGLLASAAEGLRGGDRVAVARTLAVDHENLREAWAAALRSEDDELWGSAALAVGAYLEALNRYREGVEWMGAARLRAAEVGAEDGSLAALAHAEGFSLARLGRFDEAARAIVPALHARDRRLRASAHEVLGHFVELWRGRYPEAGRHLREAEALYREAGDVAGGARIAFSQATLAWIAGSWDDAYEQLSGVRETFRGLADRYMETVSTGALGAIDLDRGRLAEARRALDRALEGALALADVHVLATIETNLVHVRVRQGEREGLGERLKEALAVFERLGDEPWVADAAATLALLRAHEGRAGDAARDLRTGLDAALRIRHVPSLAEVLATAADIVAVRAPDDATRLRIAVLEHPETYANTKARCAAALGLAQPARRRAEPNTVGAPADRSPDALVALGRDLLDGALPSGRRLHEAIAAPTQR
jgi:predicted ATPase